MALRSTHQWVDVLRGGDGDVRVTRQYIEILTGPVSHEVTASETITVTDTVVSHLFNETASETITVTDTAVSPLLTKSASESITVTDTAVITRGYNPIFIETITVVDTAKPSFFEVSLTETITLVDTAYHPATISKSANESITVTDSATHTIIKDINELSETIVVTDLADTSVKVRNITETITVTDSVTADNSTKTGFCIERITLTDTAVPAGTRNVEVYEAFIPDDLRTQDTTTYDPVTGQKIPFAWVNTSSIQDSCSAVIIRQPTCREAIIVNDIASAYLIVATGDHEETCLENITVTDSASVTDHLANCTENITVSDTAVHELSLPASENITVTDSIDIEIILGRTITETITVTETLAYELVSGISLCTYHPFVGGSTITPHPTPPSTVAPTETPQGNFVFSYPVVGPTDTVTLVGPESDDRERLHVQRINRTSRGLTLHVYADPQWPKVKRLSLGVDVCSETKAQELIDFITLTVGQEVKLRDWHNRNWQGIITNPDAAVVRTKMNSWTVAIEFEAETTEL
jgi:hypothetical protein